MSQQWTEAASDLWYQHSSLKSEIIGLLESHLMQSEFIGGNSVQSFENAFADYCQADYCLGVGNGTDALEIGLKSLGLAPGAKIVVPANTFFATAEAVVRNGYVPIFCDVEENFNISARTLGMLEKFNPDAVIAVHLYGNPAPIEEISEFCRSHNMLLVEDCAQGHGATIAESHVGTFGEFGAFSFFPGKNLGALGDGGAILTNNKLLFEASKLEANHGRQEKNSHVVVGRNSRLDSFQASVLELKLGHLDIWSRRRSENAALYSVGLSEIDWIRLPEVAEGSTSAWHQYVVRVGSNLRDRLMFHLEQNGIQARVIYPEIIPLQPAFKGALGEWESARNLSKQIISLPVAEHLSSTNISNIVRSIREFDVS